MLLRVIIITLLFPEASLTLLPHCQMSSISILSPPSRSYHHLSMAAWQPCLPGPLCIGIKFEARSADGAAQVRLCSPAGFLVEQDIPGKGGTFLDSLLQSGDPMGPFSEHHRNAEDF